MYNMHIYAHTYINNAQITFWSLDNHLSCQGLYKQYYVHFWYRHCDLFETASTVSNETCADKNTNTTDCKLLKYNNFIFKVYKHNNWKNEIEVKVYNNLLVSLFSIPVCILGKHNHVTNYSVSEYIPHVVGCNYSEHVH